MYQPAPDYLAAEHFHEVTPYLWAAGPGNEVMLLLHPGGAQLSARGGHHHQLTDDADLDAWLDTYRRCSLLPDSPAVAA